MVIPTLITNSSDKVLFEGCMQYDLCEKCAHENLYVVLVK